MGDRRLREAFASLEAAMMLPRASCFSNEVTVEQKEADP